VLAGSFRTLVDGGERDMRSVLTAMARTLAQLTASARSVTMTVLEISADRQELCVFSAGAPPVLVRAPDGSVEPCVLRGTPLGAVPFQLGEAVLKLEPGMRVLMVTDGILEMATVEGRELGLRRLRKLFTARANLDVPAVRDGLMEDIDAARGSLHMEDDLTLLIVGRD
jgi:serine phosphatase RsbU (regulator of sigma subunit)